MISPRSVVAVVLLVTVSLLVDQTPAPPWAAVAALRDSLNAAAVSTGPLWPPTSQRFDCDDIAGWPGLECRDGLLVGIELDPSLGRLAHALQGTLPPEMWAAFDVERLAILNLRGIGGLVPDALGQLVNLTAVELVNDSFTGEVPELLGNAPLETLDLSGNAIQGFADGGAWIGAPSLTECRLHGNCFSGPAEPWVSKCGNPVANPACEAAGAAPPPVEGPPVVTIEAANGGGGGGGGTPPEGPAAGGLGVVVASRPSASGGPGGPDGVGGAGGMDGAERWRAVRLAARTVQLGAAALPVAVPSQWLLVDDAAVAKRQLGHDAGSNVVRGRGRRGVSAGDVLVDTLLAARMSNNATMVVRVEQFNATERGRSWAGTAFDVDEGAVKLTVALVDWPITDVVDDADELTLVMSIDDQINDMEDECWCDACRWDVTVHPEPSGAVRMLATRPADGRQLLLSAPPGSELHPVDAVMSDGDPADLLSAMRPQTRVPSTLWPHLTTTVSLAADETRVGALRLTVTVFGVGAALRNVEANGNGTASAVVIDPNLHVLVTPAVGGGSGSGEGDGSSVCPPRNQGQGEDDDDPVWLWPAVYAAIGVAALAVAAVVVVVFRRLTARRKRARREIHERVRRVTGASSVTPSSSASLATGGSSSVGMMGRMSPRVSSDAGRCSSVVGGGGDSVLVGGGAGERSRGGSMSVASSFA